MLIKMMDVELLFSREIFHKSKKTSFKIKLRGEIFLDKKNVLYWVYSVSSCVANINC